MEGGIRLQAGAFLADQARFWVVGDPPGPGTLTASTNPLQGRVRGLPGGGAGHQRSAAPTTHHLDLRRSAAL
jgi:hypothetical protein